ncbi:MAG: T9SS type A sorting domain-containing protein, partial [Bacteroidia bacterium]|nr:T9SS type A sorting domain-containing protein [Bacteroidia bacterium]
NFRLDYEFPVVNSYDPNQISVYPPGHCEERYVQRGTPLTYTVQFQNTGTAEALEVMIVDSIQANLDFSTMSFRAASHPMILEVGPGNVLKFMFHNIHLPDSNTNEPASHGYVIYEILPQSGIQSGTVVYNQAAIYFDLNAPVWTNITSNTIVDVVPACAVGVAENEHDELSIFPNPASEQLTLRSTAQIGAVTVYNLMGQSIFYTQFVDAQELQINVAAWPKGIYLLHAQGKVRRIVVQ